MAFYKLNWTEGLCLFGPRGVHNFLDNIKIGRFHIKIPISSFSEEMVPLSS